MFGRRHMPLPEISFAWERHIPFWAWTIVPYWSLNIFYALGLFLCWSRVALVSLYGSIIVGAGHCRFMFCSVAIAVQLGEATG